MSQEVKVALIGAAATLLAAIIGGVFLLQSVSGASPATPQSGKGSVSVSAPLTPTSPPTPTPQQPPRLTAAYQGTIHNTTYTTYGDTQALAIASIVQNNEQISGRVIVGDGVHASGPFTGAISGDRSISFTDTPTDGSSALIFSGKVNPNGSMSGTYIYPGYGGGTWQVSPS